MKFLNLNNNPSNLNSNFISGNIFLGTCQEKSGYSLDFGG